MIASDGTRTKRRLSERTCVYCCIRNCLRAQIEFTRNISINVRTRGEFSAFSQGSKRLKSVPDAGPYDARAAFTCDEACEAEEWFAGKIGPEGTSSKGSTFSAPRAQTSRSARHCFRARACGYFRGRQLLAWLATASLGTQTFSFLASEAK